MVTGGLTPRAAVALVQQRLAAAGCPDADFDARELFRLATGRDPRLSERILTEEQAARLETLCQRRESREPLQYLCGRWPFLDFELAVGPGVLCPRADTEVVAEAAAQTLAGCAAPKVLDLCAGTGCLGLGIKRLCPTASVTCVEKSPEALHYLVCNVRTALRSLPQGSTEDVLEEDEPTLGSGLLGIAALPPAAQAVEGDLFDYWRGLPEGGLDLIVSKSAVSDGIGDGGSAAGGGKGACHGFGCRGGWAGLLPGFGSALPDPAAPRRDVGAGDRLAAAGGCLCLAASRRLDADPLHPGSGRQ